MTRQLRLPPTSPLYVWALAAVAAGRLADKGDHGPLNALIVAAVDPEGDKRSARRLAKEQRHGH